MTKLFNVYYHVCFANIEAETEEEAEFKADEMSLDKADSIELFEVQEVTEQ